MANLYGRMATAQAMATLPKESAEQAIVVLELEHRRLDVTAGEDHVRAAGTGPVALVDHALVDEHAIGGRRADPAPGAQQETKAGGIQVNTPDKNAFVAASKSVYDEFGKEVQGAKALIERAIALGH